MEKKLKQCPFCGSKAEANQVDHCGYISTEIKCSECDVLIGSREMLNEQQAIEAWNQRLEYKLRTNEDILTLEEAIETINSLRKINREFRVKLYPKKEKSDYEIIEELIKSKSK